MQIRGSPCVRRVDAAIKCLGYIFFVPDIAGRIVGREQRQSWTLFSFDSTSNDGSYITPFICTGWEMQCILQRVARLSLMSEEKVPYYEHCHTTSRIDGTKTKSI